MAEKKTTAAKATTAKKAAAKPAAEKKAPAKKAATTKTAKAEIIYVNAENAGFKAGDIYNTLDAAQAPMTVAEIAKAANTTEGNILLGAGWLLKEGKLSTTEDNKLTLA